MFDKYEDKIRRRIYSLLSYSIDSSVKLGITDPKKIAENFIKEIQKKELDTWISLRQYIDSSYFYNECIIYIESKIGEYIERYKGDSEKGMVTPEQAEYLGTLIVKSIKHKDFKIRKSGFEELKEIITMLSKSSASRYIDDYKGILGWNKNNKEH